MQLTTRWRSSTWRGRGSSRGNKLIHLVDMRSNVIGCLAGNDRTSQVGKDYEHGRDRNAENTPTKSHGSCPLPQRVRMIRRRRPNRIRVAPFAALLTRSPHGDSYLTVGSGSRAGWSGATEPWVAAGSSRFELRVGS